MPFSAREFRIINALRSQSRPVTTGFVADRTEMSWQAAKRALDHLFDKGYVRRGRSTGGTTYWELV
jgi:DNA-binding IclR family transcriptional regulator